MHSAAQIRYTSLKPVIVNSNFACTFGQSFFLQPLHFIELIVAIVSPVICILSFVRFLFGYIFKQFTCYILHI